MPRTSPEAQRTGLKGRASLDHTPDRARPGRGRGLTVEGARLAYERRVVATDLNLELHDDAFTVIIGPNACGKSTLLKALARVIAPGERRILLDGHDLHRLRTKEIAPRIGRGSVASVPLHPPPGGIGSRSRRSTSFLGVDSDGTPVRPAAG